MSVLLTGGAGYIGSHIAIELLNRDEDVVIVDNFYNSSKIVLDRIKEITGKDFKFYEADIRDKEALNEVFQKEEIEIVIHLAGLKAVGESVSKPIEYYDNNVNGTLVLLDVMRNNNVKNIVFSSSATVYGNPKEVPVKETTPKGICTNPYGWTKWMIEQIIEDVYTADNEWGVVILRYFNPVGAHDSGLIGEDPKGIPNNLTPYITQVAVGKLEKLTVFGNDYDTEDGTGVRDYIHVVDLALGHVESINKIREHKGMNLYNLGTGRGTSVLEMVDAFEKVSGKKIPYEIKERRPGDIATVYCDTEKAKKELGWEAKYDIERMAKDAWRWQENNPNGFEK
ncbi:UDP-glucose 4-epimerase GalE [Helcococcus kunzii]|uniref:UDP-glucose 4-epimerase GalE n=1 Tax=Helcococcus kunzii TaxID=40091 RepID=UPI001C9542EF|nr:UDP-glucose 4-epimerase GalE [Helcococcus kunzii]MCT1796250.1 UDP-glucose 4-epimerase GalE [Helcococcus kunzii]MCT1989873.1 UDP-glucose 4-epimerase GalE [Helcococcus kunzii]QZO76676.1 UDP-glucose 4-epimerase GalE [Helcococcus kunzii]